jgi:hypothetical protein
MFSAKWDRVISAALRGKGYGRDMGFSRGTH